MCVFAPMVLLKRIWLTGSTHRALLLMRLIQLHNRTNYKNAHWLMCTLSMSLYGSK